MPSTSPTRVLLLLALCAVVACNESEDAPGDPLGSGATAQEPDAATDATRTGPFASDVPGNAGGDVPGARPGFLGAVRDTSAPSEPSGAEAERAISEADIIQIVGQRLYALSEVAGLTVVDLTNPAELAILGRYRDLHGTPFEMYLRDGVVLAMYSSWGQFVKQPDGQYSWAQTGKVVALNVENPAAMSVIGSFDVAGEVSDSRIVGDLMYVVSHRNGFCWGCANNQPLTAVLSLDVRDPRNVRKVDELTYGDADNQYGRTKRSVTVTSQRMYVAGPVHGADGPTGSTIQVVDISDPAGDLVQGASVKVEGQVSSRWQMDEHEGVLRVISQGVSRFGSAATPPAVQTYKVVSSQELTALGRTELVIPPNELLNTVRFDGLRGYAITSERTDPLFTIDLTDPAAPRQLGELEMPGWIYHLVPRGDRLIGLGYDQGNPDGAITVSTFDVSDLATPKLLDRVNFGGSWASLPEEQDRIHKAFRIVDELGLVLVPFSGWSSSPRGRYCYSPFRSGVQLVDLVGDDLTLRGAAPSRGEARRAIVHGDKLLTVSDEAVDSFDLANRDMPAPLGQLTIARNVSHALPLANGMVARINQNWYEDQNSTLDFVAFADAAYPERSVAELSLSELIASGAGCSTNARVEHAFVQGNQLNISYERWDDNPDPQNPGSVQVHGVATIDATFPTKPTVLSKLETRESDPAVSWGSRGAPHPYGYSPASTAVRTESALVILEHHLRSYRAPWDFRSNARLRVIDLRNPALPVVSLLPLPEADGYWGLVGDGSNVMLSHSDKISADQARFFLDRVDLTDPSAPRLLPGVNIPGQLMHYDPVHGRMLTSDLLREVSKNVTSDVCLQRFAYAEFLEDDSDFWIRPSPSDVAVDPDAPWEPAPPVGTCTGYRERLHLVRVTPEGAVREDTYVLGERERISSSSMGDARVAAVISLGYLSWYRQGLGRCSSCGRSAPEVREPVEVLTLGGFDTGRLVAGRLGVANQPEPWRGLWSTPSVYAFGTRVLMPSETDAAIIDVSDPAVPSAVRTVPLAGMPASLHASGGRVIMALGKQGVQYVDL